MSRKCHLYRMIARQFEVVGREEERGRQSTSASSDFRTEGSLTVRFAQGNRVYGEKKNCDLLSPE